MPYASIKAKKAQARRYYAREKKLISDRSRAWQLANPERTAFIQHRAHAKSRGIEFLFTFEAWIEWWQPDFHLRGGGMEDLCMGRYGDDGPYLAGNVYKVTMIENKNGSRPLPEPDF